MKIRVGDLVRLRGKDWLQKPLGIVTEVKQMRHEQSETDYTVVTAVVGGKYFTFPDESYELVSRAERKNK